MAGSRTAHPVSVSEVRAESDQAMGDVWDPPVDFTHHSEAEKEIVKSMLREECMSFSKSVNEISCIQELQLIISLKDTEPIAKTYFSVPKPLYSKMKNHLHDLTVQGWMEKSNSLYASSILCVCKKHGTLRLCIDYWELRLSLTANQYLERKTL